MVGLHEPAQQENSQGQASGSDISSSAPVSGAEGTQLEVLCANATDIVEPQRVRIQAAHLYSCMMGRR
jgi:activator of HSP90 ATPase